MSNRSIAAFTVLAACALGLPTGVLAQTGWGEPLKPKAPEEEPPAPPPLPPRPAEPDPEPVAPSDAAPNPEWSDPPPTEFEERAPGNPDWVEEDEAPQISNRPTRASQVYGIRYANRRLTMPRGMMRGTFDTVIGRRVEEQTSGTFGPFGPIGTISTMNLGVAISIANDLEIGFSRYRMGSYPPRSVFPDLGFGPSGLVSMLFSPDVAFGDIPFYARFQPLDNGVSQIAFDAVFRIPSRTEFGFQMGVPMRFVAQDRYAFDTGVNFSVDNNPNGPSIWSLGIPFSFVANVTDQVFLNLDSGMEFFDLSGTISTATSGLIEGPFYFFPLGFGGGYTFDAKSTMLDLFASFRFPTLYGFTASDSRVQSETWAVTIGLNIHSPVLFKRSAL